jgi:nucleoside-diphosphate-sugar epimerase
MIYGTLKDRNMSRLLRWLKGWPLVPVPGGGHTMQQPVHVEDLCDAMFTAFERAATVRKEYDLGGPTAMPLSDVIRMAATALGRRVTLVPIPLESSFKVVRLMKRLGLPVPVRDEQVMRLSESKAVDISAAQRDLDFNPRTFEDGIRAEASML